MTELLAERIARHACDIPDAHAVVDRRESVSYAEFWARVTRAAAGMRGMRRIAVLPTSDVGSLVAVTAAMRSGVGVVLLHRHLLAGQFAHVIELTQPGAVIAAPAAHRRLRQLGCESPRANLDSDGQHDTACALSELLVGITSGTTGEPKLFVRNQLSWARTLDRSDEVFDVRRGDRVSTPGVLDHTHFLYGALHGLTRGACVDLRPVAEAMTSAPTHLYSVPTIAWDVVRSGIGTVPSVREVLSSAARWPSSGREALQAVLPNASLVHFYGASELSFVSYDRGVDPGAGTLFDGVDAEIRDGIVHVRSDMLFDGYLTRGGISGGPKDGWMTVGDRGSLDNRDGGGRTLILFGRDSETLIRAGLNVELAPIEAAALDIPGVDEAAVVAIADARMGEVPALAVVLHSDGPSGGEIRRALRAALPSPSMPSRILVLDGLPRTPRGKLDRQALGATFATHRATPETTNHIVSAPPS
ncbi:o-succinylbenzoate--CoA ligase [Rhodococcus sp. EPR-157]|uniref:AMP-binding protein n=1 Tax=Rhodococcus sp. EPR-157 TaxID=1813677 RepID=UPI0007BAEB8C|nr:AMP-binding protein [Rhodococcus sp. EPR-157]KZE98159.1 o-succinylbenzoate--CoA ligase [Rhodococcus sp. EPR-157]